MTFDEIKELIAAVTNADIAELSVETNGVKISIKKGAAFAPAPAPVPAPAQAPATPAGRELPKAEAAQPAESDDDRFEGGATIAAPMVGTFYRAPAPDAKPYVNVGDMVEVGQPLCIIEAMKLMNEIESEVKGRIVKILVEDSQPVEYGQPLFVIDPE